MLNVESLALDCTGLWGNFKRFFTGLTYLISVPFPFLWLLLLLPPLPPLPKTQPPSPGDVQTRHHPVDDHRDHVGGGDHGDDGDDGGGGGVDPGDGDGCSWTLHHRQAAAVVAAAVAALLVVPGDCEAGPVAVGLASCSSFLHHFDFLHFPFIFHPLSRLPSQLLLYDMSYMFSFPPLGLLYRHTLISAFTFYPFPSLHLLSF